MSTNFKYRRLNKQDAAVVGGRSSIGAVQPRFNALLSGGVIELRQKSGS